MIEIIVTVWLVSFILSTIVTSLNFFAVRRQMTSRKLARLNGNLAKVGLFWSNVDGNVRALRENSVEIDRKKTLRSALLLQFACFFSLPGFLFLSVVVISLRFIARSRKEKAAFGGPLATSDNLAPEAVAAAVEDLKHIV